MIRSLLAISFASSIAFTVPVVAQSEDALRFIEVAESFGCVLNESNQEAGMAALGPLGERLEAIGNELIDIGRLQIRGSDLVLTGGNCPEFASEDVPETLVATLRAVRDNGCLIMEREADEILGALGPREEIMAHLGDLDDVNLLHISRELGGVIGATRICEADDRVLESFAGQVPDMLALSRRERLMFVPTASTVRVLFVESLAPMGCEHWRDNPLHAFQDAGIDDTLGQVVVPLLDAGVIESREGSPEVRLSAEFCTMTGEERRSRVAAVPDLEF